MTCLVSSYIIIFPYCRSLRENPTDWLTPDIAFASNAISSPSLFSWNCLDSSSEHLTRACSSHLLIQTSKSASDQQSLTFLAMIIEGDIKKCMPEPLPQRDILGSRHVEIVKLPQLLGYQRWYLRVAQIRRRQRLRKSKSASNTRMRYHHYRFTIPTDKLWN